MPTLVVRDVLTDKVVVNRESARVLETPIRRLLAVPGRGAIGDDVVTIDFAGVEGVAPSFLDELLSVFETVLGPGATGTPPRLQVVNTPSRLSSKFEAVARGHALLVNKTPSGAWLLMPRPTSNE